MALALAALSWAGPSLPAVAAPGESPRGIEVRHARVFLTDGYLALDARLGGFWSDRVRSSLERGMPATLVVTADLWQDRANWFDRMVSTRSVLYRVRYDAWRENYTLQRGAEPAQHLPSLEAVGAALAGPIRFAVADARDVDPGKRHYVVVTASLRPLTPEGVREVERFLSSQLRGTGESGPGPATIARLPNSLLSLLAALSGLGDEIAVLRTTEFVVPVPARTGTAAQ